MVGAGRLAVAAAGAVAAWAVVPWVAMATRGTLDHRHWDAVRRLGREASSGMPGSWATIPVPRPLESPGGRPTRVTSGTDQAPPRAQP